MGLHLSAVSQLRLVNPSVADFQTFSRLYPYQEKTRSRHNQAGEPVMLLKEGKVPNDALDNLQPGVYQICGDVIDGVGGSIGFGISGYDEWLDQLSQTVIGISLENFRAAPQWFEQCPFYHLLSFDRYASDYIGPMRSRLITNEFANFIGKAVSKPDLDFISTYVAMWRLFDTASDGGVVIYG